MSTDQPKPKKFAKKPCQNPKCPKPDKEISSHIKSKYNYHDKCNEIVHGAKDQLIDVLIERDKSSVSIIETKNAYIAKLESELLDLRSKLGQSEQHAN